MGKFLSFYCFQIALYVWYHAHLLNFLNLFWIIKKESQEDSMPEPFLRGLSIARLSGRGEIVHDSLLGHSKLPDVNGGLSGELIFYFDGAHSPESMEACGRWFSSAVKDEKNSRVPLPCRGIGGVDDFMRNGCLQNNTRDPEKMSKQVNLSEEWVALLLLISSFPA